MSSIVKKDIWDSLKKYTDARIALGRSGHSIPTKELLDFGMAHALAKDAIYKELDTDEIKISLAQHNFNYINVTSKAQNKKEYLLNPNLGRSLNEDSKNILINTNVKKENIALIFADGLSAHAIHLNAIPLLLELQKAFLNSPFIFSPVIVATKARVALSDEIGETLNSLAAIMLIGERPGLSSPDSLGIYLTWLPKKGRSDAERNCISNIRPAGLSYNEAAIKTAWLVKEAAKLNKSGIDLKDDSPHFEINPLETVTLLHSMWKSP
ncbi:ethanolamine ammonia-lyase subunit EutC [Silvanigrella aquatica]|uniref:Ethanolamine ammonia-lyase small subunit n=1 Tax=Silvanigrella aquatica TaxID=1915309 RepID=A0A1L4D0K2_9BACT|nr:ethanolamine ammonia-lyase subunit EutC [Silvanigrella aquatica]APJ03718.1 hypothetical protein AXG55_07280 [Silvanigrella aquatica]